MSVTIPSGTPNWKVVILPERDFGYLMHVLEAHAQGGMSLDEIPALAELRVRVLKAQTVDLSKLGKAEIEKLTSTGVSLNLKPESSPDDPSPDEEPHGSGMSA
jgi:hypothetical protein